jgi:hypothetical protein
MYLLEQTHHLSVRPSVIILLDERAGRILALAGERLLQE